MLKQLLALVFIFCNNFSNADYWTQKSDFPGIGRFKAISFQINNIGYLGCGYGPSYSYLNDFWSFDPISNTWNQRADFPGGPRSGCVAFSIDDKGYAGLGGDAQGGFYTDFWQYDPVTNSWSSKAGFPGDERFDTRCFSIGNSGYIAGGFNFLTSFNDLWMYDAPNNSWSPKGNLPITVMDFNFITIDTLCYLTQGMNSLNFNQQLWVYNPVVNNWTQKTSFPGVNRTGASSFSFNGSGYVGTGFFAGNLFNDFWEYQSATDQWSQVSGLPSNPRNYAASWSLNNKGYIIGGKNYTNTPNVTVYNDTWEYTRLATHTASPGEVIKVNVFPNPCTDYVQIKSAGIKNDYRLQLFANNGEQLGIYFPSVNHQFVINVKNLKEGYYHFKIYAGKEILTSGSFARK